MNRKLVGFLLTFLCVSSTAKVQPASAQVAQEKAAKSQVATAQVATAQVATPLDLSTPQKTLESFVAAFNAHDLERAARCILWAQPGSKARAKMQIESAKSRESFSLRRLRVETAGEEATVRMMAVFQLGNIDLGDRNQVWNQVETQGEFSQVRLHHQQDSWKIVPDSSNAISNALAIQDFLLWRITRIAYPEAQPKTDPRLSRMREILLAAVQYLVESNQMFTGYDDTQPFEESIKSFAKLQEFAFIGADGKKVAFAFNDRLRNTNAKSLGKPENTVMFYEVDDQQMFYEAGQNTRLSFPPGKRAVFGFVDGHIEYVDAQQAASLQWK